MTDIQSDIPAHSAKYADYDHTVIDLMVEHPEHGEIPFTARADDADSLAQSLHARARAGDFGTIAPYDGSPPPDPQEVLAQQMRARRDARLRELDGIVANPLRWEEFSAEQKVELANYRQALLDVPQQAGFPDEVDWPLIPLTGRQAATWQST